MTKEKAEKPLRVGVIGVHRNGRGFGARAHILGILAAPNIELTAVCTTREETARLAADTYGASRYYVGVDDLVADPDIDLVTIAVRVRSHYSLAWTALKAGKMVYCEWPLGLNAAEARTMARLAEQTGVLTGVGTQGRYSPGILYLKQLIEDGFMGQPLFFHMTHLLPRFPVRSDHWWSAMEEEHSGALGVATAHATDTLQSVLGSVASVSGYAETLHPNDFYSDTDFPFEWTAMDTVSYQAVLETGVTGIAHVSNVATHQIGFRLDVFGKDGQVTATAPYYVSYSPMTLWGMRAGEAEPQELPIPADYYRAGELSEDSPGYNVGQALGHLRRAWLAGETFQPSFAEGYRLHRLLDGIKYSWARRRWVDVDADKSHNRKRAIPFSGQAMAE
jgi:predicted dehydrogenase